MDTDQTARTIVKARRFRPLLPIAVLVLVGGTTLAGCADNHPASADHPSTAAAAAMTSDPMDMGLPGAADAWAHRPAFTKVTAMTEEAYAYALSHPQIVQWMPCYCGCGAMGHRSNLDCYFKPSSDGQITFEEHASYCDVCVQITLKTKELMAQGASVHGARQAIDALFGGTAPGTPTEVPPL